mmetsp:Transcript_121919/g.344845  ORF Transcript_121919/g.344845 Transcript_121919/m.344845 type:complete len:328 (+) Transcript_121919:2183-3166(+)
MSDVEALTPCIFSTPRGRASATICVFCPCSPHAWLGSLSNFGRTTPLWLERSTSKVLAAAHAPFAIPSPSSKTFSSRCTGSGFKLPCTSVAAALSTHLHPTACSARDCVGLCSGPISKRSTFSRLELLASVAIWAAHLSCDTPALSPSRVSDANIAESSTSVVVLAAHLICTIPSMLSHLSSDCSIACGLKLPDSPVVVVASTSVWSSPCSTASALVCVRLTSAASSRSTCSRLKQLASGGISAAQAPMSFNVPSARSTISSLEAATVPAPGNCVCSSLCEAAVTKACATERDPSTVIEYALALLSVVSSLRSTRPSTRSVACGCGS